jgi:hypothetical protein
MWSNFSAMPGLLKFITAHAFASFVFVVASLVPQTPFSINGHAVSYSEWWTSGAGPLVTFLGIALPICGYLFLLRKANARAAYLASLAIALLVSDLILRQPLFLVLGDGCLVAFGGWYLYRRPAVVAYFASNNRVWTPPSSPDW